MLVTVTPQFTGGEPRGVTERGLRVVSCKVAMLVWHLFLGLQKVRSSEFNFSVNSCELEVLN